MTHLLKRYITEIKDELRLINQKIMHLQSLDKYHKNLSINIDIAGINKNEITSIKNELNTYVVESHILIQKLEHILQFQDENDITVETLTQICDSAITMVEKSNRVLNQFSKYDFYQDSSIQNKLLSC